MTPTVPMNILVDQFPFGFFQSDPEGHCIYVNKRWMEMTGLSAEEGMGDGWLNAVHPDDRRRIFNAWMDACEARVEYHQEYRYVDRLSNVLWVSVHITPLFNSDGTVASYQGTVLDITPNMKAVEALHLSEDRLRQALESVEDGIWDWNLPAGEVFYSPRWTSMLGYTQAELKGHISAWESLIHPSDKARVIDLLQRHLGGMLPMFECEYRLRHKNGNWLWAHGRGKVVSFSDIGKPIRMVGITSDITERKNKDAVIQRERDQSQKIVNGTPALIIGLTPDGTTLFVNPAAEKVTGYSGAELIGKNWWDTFYPGELRSQVDKLMQDMRSGDVRDYEMSLRTRWGDDHTILWSSVSHYDEQGRISEIIGFGNDITARKEAEESLQRYLLEVEDSRDRIQEQARLLSQQAEELARAKERAEAATRAKSEFLATMSHEIRTPMNGVIGMTGLLLDTTLTAEQAEYARTIQNSADALLTIINDILDFSKIEAGKLNVEPIPFDLRVAFEEVTELLMPKAAEKQLDFVLRFPPDKPSRFIGDPGRIRQILVNLASNSIKFTGKGHVLVDVDFPEIGAKEAMIKVEVTDTGIGIPEDKLDILFEKFSQVDSSTTRKFGGTGLGLAICKRLCQLMNGDIGIRSELGKGSTFWFTLRLPMDTSFAADPLRAGEIKGLRTLVVDDVMVNRQVYQELLCSWGAEADVAADGAEAWQMIQHAHAINKPYRLALVDWRMPEMDGEELGKIIRNDARFTDLQLMMVTSSSEKGHAKKFLEAGFAAYLVKPVRAATLHDSIAAVLNRSRHGKPGQLVTRHLVNELRSASQQAEVLPPGAKWTVLLAEDNLINQKVATRLLEKLNLTITIAQNGQEALEKAQSAAFDLILMDCQMPEMDGYEATEAIRKLQGAAGKIPIVAMTANAMQGDREKCIAAGMDDYITKPIKSPELARMVDEWAPKGRRVRQDHGLVSAASASAEPVKVAGHHGSNGNGNSNGSKPANGTTPHAKFDLDRLRMLKELLGGQDSELCQELLDPFVVDSEVIFANIRSAIAGKDLEKVEAGAHRLKGSCGNLGAMKLMESSGVLMNLGRNKSLQGADKIFEQMEHEFQDLKTHLAEIKVRGIS